MSILRRLVNAPAAATRSGQPFVDWASLYVGGSSTASGQVVTPETAARSAAVTACQRVLTTTVASLPIDVIRTRGKRREVIDPIPTLVKSPSGTVRRRTFVAQTMKSLTGDGNGYWRFTAADQMETLAFSSVTWRKDDNGVLRPFVDNKPAALWPTGDLVHIAASPFVQAGSPVADSPVELAKQSIGTGLAAEEFGARFFGDGYHPTVVATSPDELTRRQAQQIKDAINNMRQTREPGVFGKGLDLKAWEINPEDSQFIDLMRFEVEQACRFFGVPPAMAYAAVSGQNVTYANVTDSDLQFLKHSVQIWLLDIEDAWSTLLADPDSVKFNVDGLLRMDAKSRHEIYRTRLETKTISINGVRELEDEDPFDDPVYDEPGIPGDTSQEAL